MNLAKANRKIAALEKQVRDLEAQIQASQSQESKGSLSYFLSREPSL